MKPSIHEFLRTRLRKIRAKHGVSQERFARIAGINYKYYQSVEAGRRKEIRISTLERLAQAYNLRIDQLIHPVMPNTTEKIKRLFKKK